MYAKPFVYVENQHGSLDRVLDVNRVNKAWIQLPTLMLTSCVTISKQLNISET